MVWLSVHRKLLCVNPRVRALQHGQPSVTPDGLLVQPCSVMVPSLKENNGAGFYSVTIQSLTALAVNFSMLLLEIFPRTQNLLLVFAFLSSDDVHG